MRFERRDLAPWTIVHGFCAGMGCFAFQVDSLTTDSGAPVIGSSCRRLTLTARGVALLADCGLLPDIERKYLNDKSKSDGLSKFIACIQAAWLINCASCWKTHPGSPDHSAGDQYPWTRLLCTDHLRTLMAQTTNGFGAYQPQRKFYGPCVRLYVHE